MPKLPKSEKIKTTTPKPDPQHYQLVGGTYLDDFLVEKMRPHQLEGVKFMYQCISGQKGNDISGCILADSMGLGKTLQTIGVIWVALKRSPYNLKKPLVYKVIIVVPLSLVKNWENQFKKWLGNQKLCPLIALGDSLQIKKKIKVFVQQNYRVLILSYESFKNNMNLLNSVAQLIVFDEGHRLKNINNRLYQQIIKFRCIHRIILSGTPIQNSLKQLYACASLVNSKLFSCQKSFINIFQKPIENGLKKSATHQQRLLAKYRGKQLSKIIKRFALRRKPQVLESILPPRHQYLIYLDITQQQQEQYQNLICQNQSGQYQNNKPSQIFTLISSLRKYLFFQGSPKLKFIFSLIQSTFRNNQKLIIVSYYTQQLDYIANKIVHKDRWLSLDGRVAGQKRQNVIDKFNNQQGHFVLGLAGMAGGVGLNLVASNKMIITQPNWNPTNDIQVMGRIWREGQNKQVYIYRLIIRKTYQQKILQRQSLKMNLSKKIIDQSKIEQRYDFSQMHNIFNLKKYNKNMTIFFKDQQNEIDNINNQDITNQMKKYICFVKEVKIKKQSKCQNQFQKQEQYLMEQQQLLDQDQPQSLVQQQQKEIVAQEQQQQSLGLFQNPVKINQFRGQNPILKKIKKLV